MTSRELVIKTLNHEPIPRVPRELWISSGEDSSRSDELAELNVRFPGDIVTPEATPHHGKKPHGKPGKAASSPPQEELLANARFSKINKFCQSSNRFVLGWSETRPFDHLCSQQGGEAALVELARDAKPIRERLAAIHDFACKELALWAASEVDGVAIRDCWGAPEGPSVSPEMWREVFRPLYKEYCKILHAKDKFVFFHSHGDVFDIFGDLVKLGVDAIYLSSQLNKVNRLVKRYRGRVTFWCEMDRQQLQDPGPLDEFREAVLAIRKELDFGSGGVIARCPWEPGIRIQTAAAFFEQWLVPLSMRD